MSYDIKFYRTRETAYGIHRSKFIALCEVGFVTILRD
jgi:hypothetical protein